MNEEERDKWNLNEGRLHADQKWIRAIEERIAELEKETGITELKRLLKETRYKWRNEKEPEPEQPQEETKEEPQKKRKYKKRKKHIRATAEAIGKKTYKSKAEKKIGREQKYSDEILYTRIPKAIEKNGALNTRKISIIIYNNKQPGGRLIKRIKGICEQLIQDGILENKGKTPKRPIYYLTSKEDKPTPEPRPDIPHPTGETFMNSDEIADKIMDSMLDTPHRTRRELFSIVFGTTNPNSKEAQRLKRSLDMLQKYKIISVDASGDETTWFLTDEGEEIAKNKRAKREANNDI